MAACSRNTALLVISLTLLAAAQSDTVAVREALDLNGLTNVAVSEVATVEGGRVVSLDLRNRSIAELPPSLSDLDALQELFLAHNPIGELPGFIQWLLELRVLDVADMGVTEIPGWIRRLTNLQRLSLADNELTTLPEEIVELTPEEGVDLSGNDMQDLPQETEEWVDQYSVVPTESDATSESSAAAQEPVADTGVAGETATHDGAVFAETDETTAEPMSDTAAGGEATGTGEQSTTTQDEGISISEPTGESSTTEATPSESDTEQTSDSADTSNEALLVETQTDTSAGSSEPMASTVDEGSTEEPGPQAEETTMEEGSTSDSQTTQEPEAAAELYPTAVAQRLNRGRAVASANQHHSVRIYDLMGRSAVSARYGSAGTWATGQRIVHTTGAAAQTFKGITIR